MSFIFWGSDREIFVNGITFENVFNAVAPPDVSQRRDGY
jgi:hypothetical protein